ncbi:hypothetical protein [Brevibacillus laterosporus]
MMRGIEKQKSETAKQRNSNKLNAR